MYISESNFFRARKTQGNTAFGFQKALGIDGNEKNCSTRKSFNLMISLNLSYFFLSLLWSMSKIKNQVDP
jgi:hypothetical protein